MKIKLVSFVVFILLSLTVFSMLSSNSYSYFKENQDKLFIGDTVVVKMFDGEVYQNTADVVEMLNEKELSYVVYYREENTYYVLVNDYDAMLKLEMKNNQIVEQVIGEYQYKQLDVNNDSYELFIAVEGLEEDELVELFTVENEFFGFTDGTLAFFTQAYEGMMNLSLYLIFMTIIFIIILMFLSLYLTTQKENIGVMNLLGYSPIFITKKYVIEILIYYIFSMIFIYIFNYEYLNFIFTQSYVFEGFIRIIFSFFAIILFTSLVSGAVVYYYVNKFTAVKFIREVSYD